MSSSLCDDVAGLPSIEYTLMDVSPFPAFHVIVVGVAHELTHRAMRAINIVNVRLSRKGTINFDKNFLIIF